MKTFSFLTSAGRFPEENEITIPEGWNGVLYNDDPNDPDDEFVRASSLPKPGELVMVYLDDRATGLLICSYKENLAKNAGVEYNPKNFVVCQYAGIEHGKPIWYNYSNILKVKTEIASNARVMYALTDPVVAWHPIELPTLPN